ncbi:MAG: 50S ribosomal protein L21 [Actinomycetota bacterium]
MYAVIKTGGKQYRVAEGDTIEVEHLTIKGKQITFTPILVVTDDGKTIFGRRELRPYSVVAKVMGDTKGDKVDVFKYQPKTGYSTRHGHRQTYTTIQITSIASKESKDSKEPAPAEKTDEDKPSEETSEE